MNLKEALAHEAAATFLNPNEFGDVMVIDGVEMPALWGEESAQANDVHEASVSAWGVNTETAVLYVPEGSMPLPVPEQNITVEAVVWTVKKARPKAGLIRLVLQRNAS